MNQGTAIALIATLAVLLLFSAFFSATETAFTSFSQARLKNLAATKKSAALALSLSGNYNKILSTLLIGNNIVNIAAASLATILFTFYFGNAGVTISTVAMTILVLVFGEISPKSLARERPEEFAMFAARPLYVFTLILTPLSFIFDCWKKLLKRIFRLNKKRPTMTEDEFKIIVDEIKAEGILNATEHELILGAMRYDETTVGAVMTPVEKITAVYRGMSASAVRESFENTNFSRMPVFDGSPDKVDGLIYRADFYELLLKGGDDFDSIVKPVGFTSTGVKISALFKELQNADRHLALVVRAGKTVGLITLEDILEELVGEIEDAYDKKPLD